MATVFGEYRNQNANRKYPFLDDVSMIATDGSQLPINFIIDAFLYPINAVGPVYLSRVDFGTNTLEFTDAGTRNVCGIAEWTTGVDSAPVLDVSGYDREIGMVVFDTAAVLPTADIMLFAAGATTLAPTCCVPLIQTGVRGLITQTDSQLFTGAIKFVGHNGVQIHSYIRQTDGVNIIRIDIVGVPPAPVENCDGQPPIRRIIVRNAYCSPIIASAGTGATINLIGAPGFDLDGQCTTSRLPTAAGLLPAQKDVCNPGPVPEPFECPEESEFELAITAGELYIAAPTLLEGGNVVSVNTEEGLGQELGLNITDGRTLDETADRFNYALRAGTSLRGRITIALRGPLG